MDGHAVNGTCKTCGGTVAVIGLRAWCMKTYATGGCGSFWAYARGRWTKPAGMGGLFSAQGLWPR